MTIKELIEVLKEFDPQSEVGIKAACCNHAHEVSVVRKTTKGDYFYPEADVVICAEN